MSRRPATARALRRESRVARTYSTSFWLLAHNYVPAAASSPAQLGVADSATLQSARHPPASDISPSAVGCDDQRPIENKFARIDAPTALFGDGPQLAPVG